MNKSASPDPRILSDKRSEEVTVFQGEHRKYFELYDFNGHVVKRHRTESGDAPCKVYLPHDPRCTRDIIETMPAYKNWLEQLLHNLALQETADHIFCENPFRLKSIDLQAPTWFSSNKLGFVKAQCNISTDGEKQWIPGAVFLRGGSVGVLIIIQPYDGEDEEKRRIDQGREPELYSILTIQPRIAAGSLAFAELPAGMLDDSDNLGGKAAQEIEEEVGIVVKRKDLFNMSEAAVRAIHQQPYTKVDEHTPSEKVADSMYPSPGGCDEFLPLMLVQKRLDREAINDLQARKTGLRDQGEIITLKVVPLQHLWRHGGRDAKCLAALGLYENLKRIGGILPEMPAKPDDDPDN
ncbi:hypothetical protein BU23DRAFT_590928 [Bimuria novae-zelandiae CBS 107.79]|uniref:Nudix hydrolase domain-containing protein n=1 Tax=Bimuria novae-zelandiae CBS 107.79 TaxID=1447943 RepID=A0A6A5VC01_9PLEO|nr:hypothetical protein BU23DRAFT_590928 [Bimuria novae-zelandiae CBS 107.79]